MIIEREPDIVADVRDALVATGLPPHRLAIEITGAPDHARAAIRELRTLGVRIALDEVGTRGWLRCSRGRQAGRARVAAFRVTHVRAARLRSMGLAYQAILALADLNVSIASLRDVASPTPLSCTLM